MKHFEIQQTDTALITLLDEITATRSEVLITRNGAPVARIIPCEKTSSSTKNYPLRGMPITISEDFDNH